MDDLSPLKFVAPKKTEINPDELNIVQAIQVYNYCHLIGQGVFIKISSKSTFKLFLISDRGE